MDEIIQLYHGDCLEIMDKLIEQGIKVDAIITDPPYGTTLLPLHHLRHHTKFST